MVLEQRPNKQGEWKYGSMCMVHEHSYESAEEAQKLLLQVAEDYVAGKVPSDQLYPHRDKLRRELRKAAAKQREPYNI